MKYTLISALAALAISSFASLGGAFGDVVLGHTSSVVALQATPGVGSNAQAGLLSLPSRVSALFDTARAALRTGFGDAGQKAATRYGRPNQANLPSRVATNAADEYGISPFAAQAILGSDEVRNAVAKTPIHRGAVEFEDPFGNKFALYRPLATRADTDAARILVDVDNVVGNYAGTFRRDVAQFLGIELKELPANPTSYDWADFSTPIRERLLSGDPLSDNLLHFRDWMEKNEMLESFLKAKPEFFDVFNPFHRYFVEQGLYTHMDPLPGARFGLKRLRHRWDIGIVTKRWGHDPVKYGWTTPTVPADSARWISDATDNAFDSLTVMGENKADFAGNVHAVFEDSVGNIEKVRAQHAPAALRERALAAGIDASQLDAYLAEHNADVLGVVFRWAYNDKHPHLRAPNVVAVDSWDEAHAVAMAYRKLLADPEAGANGTLHWSDVPGLSNPDGTPVSSLGGKLRPEPPKPRSHVLKLNGYTPGQGLPHGMGGY